MQTSSKLFRYTPFRRYTLFLVLLLVSWCTMTISHELGHVLGGWMSGARLTKLDLAPWRMPFSLFEPDPYPLVTLWMGPVCGAFVPWLLCRLTHRTDANLIGSFCMLANGTYLAIAWFTGDRWLDTTKLIEHGSPLWSIFLFCAITLTIGYPAFKQSCQSLLSKPEKRPD